MVAVDLEGWIVRVELEADIGTSGFAAHGREHLPRGMAESGLNVTFEVGAEAAVPYPDAVNDPSLGLPHLFYQIFNSGHEQALIAPSPYNETTFELPPWLMEQ